MSNQEYADRVARSAVPFTADGVRIEKGIKLWDAHGVVYVVDFFEVAQNTTEGGVSVQVWTRRSRFLWWNTYHSRDVALSKSTDKCDFLRLEALSTRADQEPPQA